MSDEKAESKYLYRLELAHCIDNTCDGKPTVKAHIELNNWATFELYCPACKKDFVVKIEI